MTVRDENVERVRETRAALLERYCGLEGWFRHLQARNRKRDQTVARGSRRKIGSQTTMPGRDELAFFGDRLRGVDQDALRNRVLKFMRKARPRQRTSVEEIERAVRG